MLSQTPFFSVSNIRHFIFWISCTFSLRTSDQFSLRTSSPFQTNWRSERIKNRSENMVTFWWSDLISCGDIIMMMMNYHIAECSPTWLESNSNNEGLKQFSVLIPNLILTLIETLYFKSLMSFSR